MKAWIHIVLICSIFAGKALASEGPVPENNAATQEKLSLLWTVVSLNMIGADALSSFIPGKQEEIVFLIICLAELLSPGIDCCSWIQNQ